ncbi:uncharacterized protein BDV17DRAFT_283839 [Aspergillus undulatus]|uniref:uncharacterized protein n=1 Tax=Aspergillus undulatus TaxID=1810928 RepID=UPI003CCE301E
MPPLNANVYCPLCRVILLPGRYPHGDHPAPETNAHPWYAEVRGLYSDPARNIAVKGLGIVRLRHRLYAPLDSNLSYAYVDAETLHERERYEYPTIGNRLSLELLFEIFSYLSFDELQNIRLVCRDLALLAAVETRPHSYWRSRFLLGQEAEFLFPCLTDLQDRFELYLETRASLKRGLLPLINRERVRQLLEPIAALVEQETIFRDGPFGSAFSPLQQQSCYFHSPKEQLQAMKVLGSFPGQLASISADSPLIEGCRVLHYRAQSLAPFDRQHERRIGVSIVQIGARRFILGINLHTLGGCNIACLVGYHIPSPAKWIKIPSNSDANVKEICLECTDLNSSGWVGENHGTDIGIGTLSMPEGTYGHHLLAGLVRSKIVSMSISQLVDHAVDSPKAASQDVMSPSSVRSRLWISPAPLQDGLRLSTLSLPWPPQNFLPLTDIDFGGPGGLLLVYWKDLHSIGLYSFGLNGGCGISYFINGPKWERINPITPLYHRVQQEATELIQSLPDSHTITGLVAVESSQQRDNKQPILPDTLDHGCHQTSYDQLEYGQKRSYSISSKITGNCQTYASLKNLEYHNHPSPGVVGQWMIELGGSLPSSGMKSSQVAAIHIETSYARTVTSTDRNRRRQITVPQQWSSLDHGRKLYLEIPTDNGFKDVIVTAEAYFQDMAIVELSFVYRSGTCSSIGDSDNSSTRQMVHFVQNDRIVGLSTVGRAHDLLKTGFEIERDGRLLNKPLVIDSPSEAAAIARFDWRYVWCRDEAAAETYEQLSTYNRIYTAPRESRLAGIYVGCQGFH